MKKTKNHFPSAIIVTGGNPNTTSVEILKTDGTPWCTLIDFPGDRFGHTQSGLTACGGSIDSGCGKSCVTFDNGTWKHSHNLTHNRNYHSTWTSSQHGIYLIGGWAGLKTERLTKDGGSQPGFSLVKSAMYVHIY